MSLVACGAMAQVYDTGSNVGIGVVSPGFKLDVDGSLNISAGNGINIDGNQVISANGSRNIFIGDGTGLNITSGQDNAIIGFKAGEDLTTGTFNTLIGLKAGQNMTTELSNTIIGRFAGQNNTGDRNVLIGREAGISNAGLDNTFIGDRAGLSNVGGSSNTLIGKNADVGNDSLTNATAIGSGAVAGASNTVILGNGASVGVGTSTPGYELDVVGDINFTGDLYENGVLFAGGSGATGPTGPSGSDGSDGADGATGPTGPLVSGSSSQTLRHDGSDWVASSSIRNDGTRVGINTAPTSTAPLSVGNTTDQFAASITHNSSTATSPSPAIYVDAYQNNAGNSYAFYNRLVSSSTNTGSLSGTYNFLVGDNSASSGSVYGTRTFFSSSLAGYGKNLYGSYVSFSGTPADNEYAYYASNGRSYFGGRVHINEGEEATLTTDGHLQLGTTAGDNLVIDENEITARTNGDTAALFLQPNQGTVHVGHTSSITGYKFWVASDNSDEHPIRAQVGGSTKFMVNGNGGTTIGTFSNDAPANGLYVAGNVGIGVNATDMAAGYELAVDGDIICEELKVQDSGDWPDYVFADEYELKTLEEVEAHIEANSHLPGVPDAETVEEEGIMIGEMQKVMMEKIEELTLYMIDANKKIIDSDNRIKELEDTIDALKATK